MEIVSIVAQAAPPEWLALYVTRWGGGGVLAFATYWFVLAPMGRWVGSFGPEIKEALAALAKTPKSIDMLGAKIDALCERMDTLERVVTDHRTTEATIAIRDAASKVATAAEVTAAVAGTVDEGAMRARTTTGNFPRAPR